MKLIYEQNDLFNDYVDESYILSDGNVPIPIDSISRMLFEYDIEFYKNLLSDWQGFQEEEDTEAYSEILQLYENTARIQELLVEIRQGNVVPFIGAGASIPCGVPGWSNFLSDFKNNIKTTDISIFSEHLARNQLVELADLIFNSVGADHFADKLERSFYNNHLKPTGLIKHIPKLPCELIITTNVDRLIEECFERSGKKIFEITKGSEVPDRPIPGKVHLSKIHGDFNFQRTRIFTLKEYNNAYLDDSLNIDLTKPLTQWLGKIYENQTLLFIGCSLNIDYTLRVFEKFKSSKPNARFKHYAIIEDIPDHDSRIDRTRFLNDLGIFPIWYLEGRYEGVEVILRNIRKSL